MPGGQEVGVGGVKLPKAHGFDAELKALKANKRAHVPESTSSLETLPFSGTSSFLHAINIFSGKKSKKGFQTTNLLRMLAIHTLYNAL